MKLFSSQSFLVVYSGVLTVAFAASVFFGFGHETVLASTGGKGRRAEFDQITVHRINVIEADGTPRMVIANTAEFPGAFMKGKEMARPDRKGQAGLLFLNNEGTEDGALIFGGYKDADGTPHAWGHLSFDEYEQDQTLTEDMQQDGQRRSAGYEINDNGLGHITPEVLDLYNKAQALPHDTPEQREIAQHVFDDLLAKYPIKTVQRAYLGREPDSATALHLRDAVGRDRIVLRVGSDGKPQMLFLDRTGKPTHQWPDK